MGIMCQKVGNYHGTTKRVLETHPLSGNLAPDPALNKVGIGTVKQNVCYKRNTHFTIILTQKAQSTKKMRESNSKI